MKGIICKAFDQTLGFGELPKPVIAPDEVLIKVHYVGVNFPDTLIVKGKYQFKPEFPFSPGQEISGVVEEIGESVQHVKPGDQVLASMTWGGMAELVKAKAQNVYLLPGGIELNEAACLLETYATVFYALKDRGDLKSGERLLVLGASGGTGTAAVQLGKLFGAEVLAVASSEQKRQFALERGADHVFGYENLKENLKKSGGVDVIFDPVGGDISEQVFRAINPDGRHLIVGFASGKMPQIPMNLPLLKSAAIVGVFWGSFWRNQPFENRKNVALLLKWFSDSKLKVGITKTYPLKQGAQAIDDLANRRAVGKIVLKTKNAD